MYNFKHLEFSGFGTYKEHTVVPLDNQGAVWMTGLNYDSKKGSNGSGKSMIIHALFTVLYLPAADDMMHGKKNYYGRVVYEKESKRYEIHQFRKLDPRTVWVGEEVIFHAGKDVERRGGEQIEISGSGYRIYINGKDCTPHGIPECRKKIKQIFTLTEDEFRGYVHISPNRGAVLIDGTSPERRRYFESTFSVLSSYKRLQEKLGDKYDKLEEEIKELDESKIRLKTLKEQTAEFRDADALQADIESLTKETAELEQQKIQLDEEISDIEKRLHNNRKRKEIVAQLDDLAEVSEDEASAAESELSTLLKQERSVERKLESIEAFEAARQKVIDARAALTESGIEKTDYEGKKKQLESERSELDLKLRENQKFLSKLQKIDCPTCPTCDQGLNQNSIKKNIQRLEVEIEETEVAIPLIRKQIQACEAALSLIQNLKQAKAQLDETPAVEESREALIEALSTLKVRRPKLQEAIKTYERRSTISATLKKYPKEALPAKETFEKLKLKSSDLNEDLKVSIKEKSEYSYQLSQLKRLTRQISDYESALKDYDTTAAQLKLYGTLYDAYGDKGLKLKQITNLAKKLIEKLPNYTSLLFQERGISFTTDTDDENSFDIMLCRADGKKLDISRLSSGEKKRLIPALMLAQNDLLPSSKRTNLWIADELDANLDPIAKQSFANNFIPLIKKRFSTSLVIAHSDDMKSAHYDQHWQISKKDGQSTIQLSE